MKKVHFWELVNLQDIVNRFWQRAYPEKMLQNVVYDVYYLCAKFGPKPLSEYFSKSL